MRSVAANKAARNVGAAEGVTWKASSILNQPRTAIFRGLALFRRIAVGDPHLIMRLGQAFAHFFSDHDGSMLAAGAAKADGQVTFAFAHVMRQQIDEQL